VSLHVLTRLTIAFFVFSPVFASTSGGQSQKVSGREGSLAEKASELAKRIIIVDGHVDLPYRLHRSKNKDGRVTLDVSKRTEKGDFDYLRAAAGGLDAPFMSIYVQARYQDEKGKAKALADSLIDIVESLTLASPEKFALARSVADVKKNFALGRISLPMGIENGAAIEENIGNLKHFYDRGVRYMTLAHSQTNQICDSSYDVRRQWNGMSPFGAQVVTEMNRLGMMIDVSHVSDACFLRVLELSEAPVVATHSSGRAFTPKWERNMSDEMIRRLGKNQGVIMINFGSGFIEKEANRQYVGRREAIRSFRRENQLARRDPRMNAFRKQYDREHPFKFSTVEVVADHIDHVVGLVGIDHVGLGSDFDGLGDTLPKGLKDASMYPNLFRVLLERGYTEVDIEKIASGNIFRVWQEVEDRAKAHRDG
jgi:membrane dipeptidase